MKKLILSITIVMACFTASAQEPEKKKESSTPAPSRGQERAINESGVSVKSESKKTSSSSKSTSSPASSTITTTPAEEKKRDAKKPE